MKIPRLSFSCDGSALVVSFGILFGWFVWRWYLPILIASVEDLSYSKWENDGENYFFDNKEESPAPTIHSYNRYVQEIIYALYKLFFGGGN